MKIIKYLWIYIGLLTVISTALGVFSRLQFELQRDDSWFSGTYYSPLWPFLVGIPFITIGLIMIFLGLRLTNKSIQIKKVLHWFSVFFMIEILWTPMSIMFSLGDESVPVHGLNLIILATNLFSLSTIISDFNRFFGFLVPVSLVILGAYSFVNLSKGKK